MSEHVPDRLAELPEETREFLATLSRDDIDAMKIGLPIFKRILGAGFVLKWLAVALLSLLAGVVLLGESIVKILGWMRGH